MREVVTDPGTASGKTYEEVDRSIERDNILTAAVALGTAWSIRCWVS